MKSEKLFSINKEFKTISGEISIIREWDILDMYTGSRGVIINHLNDIITHWVVTHVHRDAEHDITHWELVPLWKTVMNFPQWKGYTMMVFND
jgi:hypothetical protein